MLVEGVVVTKSSYKVTDERVEILTRHIYVSRSAWKLKMFLPRLPFTCKGLYALDIGASTGGFTEVLLEEGASGVDAVDVGRGQLHAKLREDARVRSFESTDIRTFSSQKRYDIVASDVSFISLHLLLPSIDTLASRWIVLLFKPQYEVGKDVKRDKHGVLKDAKAVAKAMLRFEDAATVLGWRLVAKEIAYIKGKEGNVEHCYCFEK